MKDSSPPITIFYSYSHNDETLRDQLEKHLSLLKRQGVISPWHDRKILPGDEWKGAIDDNLNTADVVLLLVSSDFLASEYCYDVEMQLALKRHEQGDAKVIPVILRPCDWHSAPFGKLQALPKYGKPVVNWKTRDDAFLDVANGIRNAVRALPKRTRAQTPAIKSPIWNVPFSRNPFFTGREKVLEDLRQSLTTQHRAALSQIQAISGLGGIGKTQTAVEYAYRFHDTYEAVLWVLANSREALLSGFVALAQLLNLPEKNEEDTDLVVSAVKRWLELNAGWLLVLDNADEPEHVEEFLPLNPQGHILLTSRAQFFRSLGVSEPHYLEAMAPEEALDFLFESTRYKRTPDEQAAAAELARELGYLPLALEQAAAYVAQKQIRFQEYLAAYRKARPTFLSGPKPKDYPNTVATTWLLNFQEVEKAFSGAADLLRFSAFLSPDAIPFELFQKGASECGPALAEALAGFDENPLLLNDMLAPLARYSLVRIDAHSQSYSLHRLVQEVTRAGLDDDAPRLWAERVVRALNQAFPVVEFHTWPLCERLLPQGRAATRLIDSFEIALTEAVLLLNRITSYLRARAQLTEAEPLSQRSLAISEQIFGPEHPVVAQSLNNLASLYYDQGKHAEAESLYRRSLAIQEKSLGPEHPDVAQALNNLAELYRDQGKYPEAEPLYLRSLAIFEKILGPEHPHVAVSLNNLAQLYRDKGKLAEAETLFKRALAIFEKALGPEHPGVANVLENYSALLRATGRDAEAELLEQRAREIRARHAERNRPKGGA